jgi:hypothetical protein
LCPSLFRKTGPYPSKDREAWIKWRPHWQADDPSVTILNPGKPSPPMRGPKGVSQKVELPPGVASKMVDFDLPPGMVS